MPSLEIETLPMQGHAEESDDDRTVEFEKDDKPVGTSNLPWAAEVAPTKIDEDVLLTKVSNPSPSSKVVKHVTPPEKNNDSANSSGSKKQKQQRKVNQMTLGNFYFGIKKKSVPASPPCNAPSETPSVSSAAAKSPPRKQSSEKTQTAKAKRIDFDPKPIKEIAAATNDVVMIDMSKDSEEEETVKSPKVSPKRARKEKPKPQNENKAPKELSEERKAMLKKYGSMKTKYSRRSQEIVEDVRKGLTEEEFNMPEPQAKEEESSSDDDSFPDHVIANMVLLIEGSSLSLSKLTTNVSQKLSSLHQKTWQAEAITNKIKLLAKRKSYIDIDPSNKSIDLFEDETQDRMWRWEVLVVDILHSQVLSKVRKARGARKKISSHRTAISRLIQALNEAEAVISNPDCSKIDKQIAKVSQNEERVLKFEREAEKQRMVERAKRKKQEEAESKKREKERKKVEAENKKKKEAEAKKQQAAKAREDAKLKKIAEQEQKEEKKKLEEDSKKQKLNKQKACLMSFFSAPPQKKSRKMSTGDTTNSSQAKSSASSTSNSFDIDTFRSKMNSSDTHDTKSPLFPKLSSQAIASRRRRTRNVTLSVYVTVEPEGNAFDAQPFAEQQDIMVPNKYRFLSFHKDCRPPYHGTWSKRSTIVTGRNPFGKDTTHLDYDNDSEAEWEEGDDEIGEDIEDEENCKDEDEDEGEARIYDYDDGFCVADDHYLETDDDVDEETKALYKKQLQKGEGHGSLSSRVCIVAPAQGGIPPVGDSFSSHLFEGFDTKEGMDIVLAHQGMQLCEVQLYLDAFPPPAPSINEGQAPPKTAGSLPGKSTGNDEYTAVEMKTLARFAHHCELNSKEKLIEEVRNEHPAMFTSRAKAMRKLDSIAVKKRRVNATGVYWEVKKKVLEELELHDLLAKKINDAVEKQAAQNPPKAAASSKPEPSKKGKKRKSVGDQGGDDAATTKKTTTKSVNKKRKSVGDQGGGEAAKKKKTITKSVKKSSPKKSSPKRKDESPAAKASANFMASFLIKKKPKSS